MIVRVRWVLLQMLLAISLLLASQFASANPGFEELTSEWSAAAGAPDDLGLPTNPDGSMTRIYQDLYGSVSGSHVSMYNWERFGDLRSVRLSEFVHP